MSQTGKCEICYKRLEQDNIMFCNNCGQDYHRHCIQTAMKRDAACPMCKRPFSENVSSRDSDYQSQSETVALKAGKSKPAKSKSTKPTRSKPARSKPVTSEPRPVNPQIRQLEGRLNYYAQFIVLAGAIAAVAFIIFS